MSAHRTSFAEPFSLVHAGARDSHADWFATEPRLTTPSLEYEMLFFEEPELVLVRGEAEPDPALAGAVAGALAGPAMLGVGSLLAKWVQGTSAHIPSTIGYALSHGAFRGSAANATGWIAALALGSVVGALYGTVTRRLRQLAPLMAFGITLSTALWVVIHALLLPRVAPWVAKTVPFAPMAVAAMFFGVIASMQLPLRTRRIV
jgi:hypothetical protein